MSPSRWICAVALGVWAFAGPSGFAPAEAQSASEIAAAKQWFSDGLALEEKGEFSSALALFKKVAEVKKTPQVVFHVALCELKTGTLVEALVDFERAIELAKTEGNDQVESAANAELATLRPRVPALELSVRGGATPTRVLLDGQEISIATLGTPMPVNPGKHRVVAEFAGGQVERGFDVAERGKAKVELVPPQAGAGGAPVSPGAAPKSSEPGPATSPAAAPSPVPAPSSPEADRGSSKVLPWVVIGGGVLVSAGGFYMWKLRGEQKDELDAICYAPDDCPRSSEEEIADLQSKGKTYTTLAIGMWSVGALALATGGYLLLSSGAEQPHAARVAPVIGPNAAGAFVTGSF